MVLLLPSQLEVPASRRRRSVAAGGRKFSKKKYKARRGTRSPHASLMPPHNHHHHDRQQHDHHHHHEPQPRRCACLCALFGCVFALLTAFFNLCTCLITCLCRRSPAAGSEPLVPKVVVPPQAYYPPPPTDKAQALHNLNAALANKEITPQQYADAVAALG